jgi:phosphate starvation-inducible PhoH-like protein
MVMSVLLGQHDTNLKQIEARFPDCQIFARGNEISVVGPDASKLIKLVSELVELIENGESIGKDEIGRAIDMVQLDQKPTEVFLTEVSRSWRGKVVKPKTAGQKVYAEAIANNTITFGIGPAGTGKSYLAVAMAVSALKEKKVNRIILTRPAVEAGERLGFLPGDLMAKVDPYLRPLYDALQDLLDSEGLIRLIERNTIEVAPLAYMRGRTLNDSFVILDEAQNTTHEQMKMFLTRVGFGSKVVVTGDVTQIDIPGGKQGSGLVGLEQILSKIDSITFVHLDQRDVVRHKIVQDIVKAYEDADHKKDSKRITS